MCIFAIRGCRVFSRKLSFYKLSGLMALVEKIPYPLRRVFAEVVDIPGYTAFVPVVAGAMMLEFILGEVEYDDEKLYNRASAICAVGLILGGVAIPLTTACIAAPLYILGRSAGALSEGHTFGERFFKLDK